MRLSLSLARSLSLALALALALAFALSQFGFLLGYSYVVGEGDPGFAAATAASILSAPFINPVRAGVSAARVVGACKRKAARASEMRCLRPHPR